MEAVLVATTPATAALVRGELVVQAGTPALMRGVLVAQAATLEVAPLVWPKVGGLEWQPGRDCNQNWSPENNQEFYPGAGKGISAGSGNLTGKEIQLQQQPWR